jgi:hypothetical protein
MALNIRAGGREIRAGEFAIAAARLLHPSLCVRLAKDSLTRNSLRRLASTTADTRAHLKATIRWLCRAQDRCGGQGVSAAYSLVRGWEPPYPETTGYIIPTFYDYAMMTGQEEFCDRARRMADWEISVQLPSGAVVAGYLRKKNEGQRAAVFNTGQVILGFCRAFAETRDERYLTAAKRAGDWLLSVQGSDGTWILDTPIVQTTEHTYDVRTAWSLLELHACVGESKYADAAVRNLEWSLAQQHEDGWFANNAFSPKVFPYTHNISYVMEGFFESWRLTHDSRYLKATQKTAERLLRIFELRRFMPGEFDAGWKTKASYSCLTGNAQIAGVWLRLFQEGQDVRFLNAALKLNDSVKACQSLSDIHPAVRGGVKGSQPFGGGYTPHTFVNWGAKFLADSLMLEEQAMNAFERSVFPN